MSVETDGKVTEVEATHIMFAAGSEARSLPGVEFDGKVILGNREILSLPEVPKSLVIVGAGAVGVEFASIFQSFGTTVTILEMLPRMVPLEDEEISAELEKAFRKRGIQIFTRGQGRVGAEEREGATVAFRDKSGQAQTLSAERVLMAVGRGPLTSNLGLDKTRVKLERGFVHVGPFMETDEPQSTPSAISSPACRNWLTPRRWKASLRRKNYRQTRAAARAQAHSQRHLLRAADRRPSG